MEIDKNFSCSILLLEDSVNDLNLIRIFLAEMPFPFVLTHVNSKEKFEESIHTTRPDLILGDYHLHRFNGLEALKIGKEKFPDVPYIMITGALGEELAVECIKQGATDFILKDNLPRLPQIVIRALREAEEIKERRKAEKRAIKATIQGEDQERRRISQELHDSLGQTLSALGMNLEAISEQVKGLGGHTVDFFNTAQSLLHKAIRETREISHNLMPKVIDNFGLIPALTDMFEKLEKASELNIQFYNNLGKTRLDEEIELNLYRITQEALNNVLKHSNATQVGVQLIEHPNTIIYTIEDDGIGFDLESNTKKPNGLGLQSILNRCHSIGGEFSLDTRENEGVIITVEVPKV